MKHALFRFGLLLTALLLSGAASAAYYVDANRGSDRNPGTQKAPWATLTHAREVLQGPATVYVHSGNYPAFIERRPSRWQGYLHFKAAPGERPRLGGIELNYAKPADAQLIFDGFEIFSDKRMRLVTLTNAHKFRLLNSELHSDHWARGPDSGVYGIDLKRSADVLVENNRLYEVFRGVLIRNSVDVSVRHNFITVKGASGIMYMSGSKNGLIEYNHITGADYTRYPQDPLAVDKPHQSIIAISSNDLVVRGNLMHGIGSSSGMMLYAGDSVDDVKAYKNILFESNALYDTSNNNALRIYNLGENIVLRNNFFFAKKRPGPCHGVANDARYRYNVAINVHNVADGYDGSGLELYNNIFAGAVMIPEKALERDNFFWSLRMGDRWHARSSSGSSKVMVDDYLGCGGSPTLLEDGTFFTVKNDLSFPERSLLDLTLAPQSLARQLVNKAELPETFLGQVDPNGFLRAPVRRSEIATPTAGPIQEIFLKPAPATTPVSVHCEDGSDCATLAH
ncbi:right-handed parallel beta-helix repeat-containing protein [Microbulbifer hainanensis]|uniref:right-handed parallel beta-helix repeat-containing protein n=1 Tax=Microbulbifer hainanensis TaxID=2735675 RepID=UPI001866B19B|nr:right-handed parallel beta-helix repeat-containing protein [Microbulbifer hainanensis]